MGRMNQCSLARRAAVQSKVILVAGHPLVEVTADCIVVSIKLTSAFIVSRVINETIWDEYGRVCGRHACDTNILLSICRIRFTVVRVGRATRLARAEMLDCQRMGSMR